MKTRAIKVYKDAYGRTKSTVVWFGSYGHLRAGFDESVWDISEWDTAPSITLHYNLNKDSYDYKQQALVSSLIQRLSVIKSELWFNQSFGLPLFDKNRHKAEFDAFILKTITSYSEVQSILSFESKVDNKHYTCNVKILSIYGEVDISI